MGVSEFTREHLSVQQNRDDIHALLHRTLTSTGITMKRVTISLLALTGMLALGACLTSCTEGPGERKNPVDQSKVVKPGKEASGVSIAGSDDK